jgi:hypothetical protein
MTSLIKTLVFSALLLVTACATNPDNIGKQYVSDLQYQSYSCKQLEMEARRVNGRIGDVYQQAKKLANDDAIQMGIGLILFWPTLFFLEGGDGPAAMEYARLKGESEAIERSTIQKNCGLTKQNFIPPKYKEPSGGQSYIFRLKELKKLHENGTISKDEYSKKRKDIINSL